MAARKTVLTAVFVFLALAWAHAEEAPGLTPRQNFFFKTVAATSGNQ